MTSDPELHTGTELDDPPAGRPVTLTPMPPGLWMILLGVVLAALGPLFGFLIGSMLGPTTTTGNLDMIALSLLLGIVVGGLGVLVALLGARRFIAHRR